MKQPASRLGLSSCVTELVSVLVQVGMMLREAICLGEVEPLHLEYSVSWFCKNARLSYDLRF